MRKLLLIVLLALTPLASAHVEQSDAWTFVETARGVDLPEPQVVYMANWGVAGTYRPDINPDVVFVDVSLTGTDLELVVVHEMSHYVDYVIGKLDSMEAWGQSYEANLKYLNDLCVSEGTAYWVEAGYALYKGYEDYHDHANWMLLYPHCVNPEVYAAQSIG